jgi:ribokinase
LCCGGPIILLSPHISLHQAEFTPGAGDAFAGALAVALLEGYDMGAAARVAVTAAALTVTRYGSQKAYPSRHDLERWLSNNVSLRRKGV